MIRYGKSTQNAIAAISCLAEGHQRGVRLSSWDIARARELPQTLVAKLLTNLSQAGLITGSPGPHGGYALSRQPEQITLYDVSSVFDRIEDRIICPFGPNWCGHGDPCPLHDQLHQMNLQFEEYLRKTTLAVFVNHPKSSPGKTKRKSKASTK